MSILGPDIEEPPWASEAKPYYSRVEGDHAETVNVMRYPEAGEASDENPGTLCLRLAASFRNVRVFDAAGVELGEIRPRGPGFGYAMRRSGELIWTLSNRSFVLRRHALAFAGDGRWDVRTPFYWWLNIVCTENGATHVVGQMGPMKRLWQLWIRPGDDRADVLAALAFLHRRWLRR